MLDRATVKYGGEGQLGVNDIVAHGEEGPNGVDPFIQFFGRSKTVAPLFEQCQFLGEWRGRAKWLVQPLKIADYGGFQSGKCVEKCAPLHLTSAAHV